MPFAGNFHPELGYLAPAPKFVRAVRTMLVASAIGAVAGAGTVLALMDRPPTDVRKAARPVAQAALVTGTPTTTETPVAAAALTELNAGPAPAQTATAKVVAGKSLERNAASSRGPPRHKRPKSPRQPVRMTFQPSRRRRTGRKSRKPRSTARSHTTGRVCFWTPIPVRTAATEITPIASGDRALHGDVDTEAELQLARSGARRAHTRPPTEKSIRKNSARGRHVERNPSCRTLAVHDKPRPTLGPAQWRALANEKAEAD